MRVGIIVSDKHTHFPWAIFEGGSVEPSQARFETESDASIAMRNWSLRRTE